MRLLRNADLFDCCIEWAIGMFGAGLAAAPFHRRQWLRRNVYKRRFWMQRPSTEASRIEHNRSPQQRVLSAHVQSYKANIYMPANNQGIFRLSAIVVLRKCIRNDGKRLIAVGLVGLSPWDQFRIHFIDAEILEYLFVRCRDLLNALMCSARYNWQYLFLKMAILKLLICAFRCCNIINCAGNINNYIWCR